MQRKLEVGFAKKEKAAGDPTNTKDVDYAEIATIIIQETGKAVAGYVILDTFRKVAVALASK